MIIPFHWQARIGHFVEAQILEALEVDYIDESEVLTMADEQCHINKTTFKVPFVNGCRNLGEALRRIAEGAAMLRTKGEAGTGNIVEAVRHARAVQDEIRRLKSLDPNELFNAAKVFNLSTEPLLNHCLDQSIIIDLIDPGMACRNYKHHWNWFNKSLALANSQ